MYAYDMKFRDQYKILKWPIGKRAGFCISNDAEYLTLTGWEAIEKTYSEILGIENSISTSIFLVNPNSIDPAMSIVEMDGKRNLDTDKILGHIKSGKIDGLHAIGNFDNSEYENFGSLKAAELIKSMGLELKWWSNHGNENNKQNIGAVDLRNYQQGDIPGSKYYSLKTAQELGVDFYWLDDCISELGNTKVANLLKDRITRDSSKITTFFRYRGLEGMPAPTLESINIQVTKKVLEKILQTNSGLVIYQHLGISKRNGKNISSIVQGSDDIPDSAITTFKEIAGFCARGLWVTTTASFLKFIYAINNIAIKINGNSLHLESNRKITTLRNVSIFIKQNPNNLEFIYDSNFIRFNGWDSEKVKGGYLITFN